MPPRLNGGWVEVTDLLLNLWVSPDFRQSVLDEEELEEALHKGRITNIFYNRAKKEMQNPIHSVEKAEFPASSIKGLDRKQNL